MECYLKDNLYKNLSTVSFLNLKKNQDTIKWTLKIIDRVSALRLHQTLMLFQTQSTINQQTALITEHLKEKKIINKKTSIAIVMPLISNELNLYFSYLKNIIKKKIYKKYSIIFYISRPSIKIHYTMNSNMGFLQNQNLSLRFTQLYNLKYKIKQK